MSNQSLVAEARDDVARLLDLADPTIDDPAWDPRFVLKVALRIRLDPEYRAVVRVTSRLMAFGRFRYPDLTEDPQDLSPEESFAAWLEAAEAIASDRFEEDGRDEPGADPLIDGIYFAFQCRLPDAAAEASGLAMPAGFLAASGSDGDGTVPPVPITLKNGEEMVVDLDASSDSPPALLCSTRSPNLADRDLRLEVTVGGSEIPAWSTSVHLSRDEGQDERYSARLELDASVPRGRQIKVHLLAGDVARKRASALQQSPVDRIAAAYLAGRPLAALGVAWSATNPDYRLEMLLSHRVDLNALMLDACREIAGLGPDEGAAVGDDHAEQVAVNALLEAFRRSDAPEVPPLLSVGKDAIEGVTAFRREVLAALVRLATRVRAARAENPQLLPMLPQFFGSNRLDSGLIADLIALWTGDGPRPQAAERELYLTLVSREARAAGKVARLKVEAVPGGSGRFYPHPRMATAFRDEDFLRAENNAREAVLRRIEPIAGADHGLDLRWSIRLEEGGRPDFSILGESAGLALALGAVAAMAEAIGAAAEARGEAIPPGIRLLRELELDRLAASAAISPGGGLARVGSMWEKTGEALVDRKDRRLIHSLAVFRDQEGVGENVTTVRAVDLDGMIEALSRSSPRVWACRAFEEQTESLAPSDSIAGVVGWSNYQTPHLSGIPSTKEEAKEMGASSPLLPLPEAWEGLVSGPSPPRLIVFGQSGTGKSTMLRRLGRDVVTGRAPSGRRLIPAIVRLNEWLRRPLGIEPPSLPDELARRSARLGEAAPVAADWERWLRRGEVLLLLDGYDEVADVSGPAERLRGDLLGPYARCPAVITCWSKFEAIGLKLKWPLFEIHWLTGEQIENYLDAYPFRSPEVREDLKGLIARSAEVRQLASSPLHLSLLSVAAEAASPDDDAPRNEWELFRQVVETLIRRTDRRVDAVYPPESVPNDAQKFGFLGRLALWLMARATPTDSCEEDALSDFLVARADELRFSDPRGLANALMKDFVARGLVLREGPIHRLPHPALQHFLCADWIARRVRQSPDHWDSDPLAGTGHATIRALVRNHIRLSKDEEEPEHRVAETEGWKKVQDYLSTKIEPDRGLLHEVLSKVRKPGPGEIRVADLVLPAEGWGAFSPFRVGRIVVPTVRLVGGDGRLRYTHPDGVLVEDHSERRMLLDDLPDDIRTGARDRIRREREQALARDAVYENRPMIRLDSYTHGMREDDDAAWPLVLTTSRTDFETMRLTNSAIGYRLSDGRTIREKYAAEPDALNRSRLANPIATNLSVVTADHYILVARRGNRVATNPGGWAPAVSGTGTPDHDCDPDGRYNPFRTAVRESTEEVTYPYVPRFEDITFFGLARTMHYLHPFLFGELRVPLKAQDLVSMTPGDNWEVGSLTPIPFTVEAVTEWILRWYQRLMAGDIPGGGIYSAIFSLLQSVLYQFPEKWLDVVDRLGGSTDK